MTTPVRMMVGARRLRPMAGCGDQPELVAVTHVRVPTLAFPAETAFPWPLVAARDEWSDHGY